MCLGVPGRIVETRDNPAGVGRDGAVDFQGNRVEVSLALVPEAAIGDWVLVHAGLAIELLDEQEARETWEWLQAADLAEDLPAEFGAETSGHDD